MGRTFIRQDAQIRQSVTYDDTVAVGSTMETAGTNIEFDLNAVRSQLKRHLRADAAGDWFEDIPTVNSKKRAIAALNVDLDDIEEHRFLFRSSILTDITVTAGQNFEVLSVASSETPTQTAAVNAGTAEGAVVATLAGDVGSHSLTEVAGADALSPKNMVVIRDAASSQPLQSGGKDIAGLLQAESGTIDGDTFNDTTKQVQISFVRENAGGNDLEAVPIADIAGKTINYAYVRRLKFDSLPEQAFLDGFSFIDQAATSTDVTLDNAIDNQVGAATQTDRNIQWRVTDTFTFKFQDSPGTKDLLAIIPAVAGDEVEINVDSVDINVGASGIVDIDNGIRVDTGGTRINIGETVGQIDSAAALTVKSAAASDLTIDAANEIIFIDGNKAASTFAGSLKLSDVAQEWSDYETQYGEVSLLKALSLARMKKTVAVVTPTTISADVNVTGAGGTPNLDAQLGDHSGVDFVTKVNVFVNGVLMRNGANSAANHDVYPGDTPANGDLKFEFVLRGAPGSPDVITMEIFG